MTGYRDDAKELADRINEDVEEVLSKHWSGWITSTERGKRIALVTPRVKDKSKKPTSSFKVHLDGADRGKWYRFSAGVGGYGLQLLHYSVHGRLAESKNDWAETYKLAREHLGVVQEREVSDEDRDERERRRQQENADREERNKAAAVESEKKRVARVLSAQDVWADCIALKGSHGDAYLQARGLPPVSEWPWDPHEAIRFHPALEYELDRKVGRLPAIVARVQDAFDDTIAVWQIYLDPKLPQKAAVENAKVGRGPATGGAVRIGGVGPKIGAGEGLETCLAAWVLEGFRYPVWSCLSTSGVMGFEPPSIVERLCLFPDGDSGVLVKNSDAILDPPGLKAARELRSRMNPAGVHTTIQDMCLLGDSLDLLITKREHEKRIQSA